MIAMLGLFGACSQGGADGATASATSPQRPTTSSPTPTAPAAPTSDTGFPEDWAPPPLDWVDCDLPRNGRCASLEVPLDWDDPEGPTIRLRLGRVLAEGNRIGSLLVNPGGPGGSGLEFLSYDPVSPDLADRFDLVSWDPRGVGDSTAVQCGDEVDALLVDRPRSRRRRRAGRARRGGRGGVRRVRQQRTPTCCPTSAPTTSPATWRRSVGHSATTSSTTWASPTARRSARPTPRCSPSGSGRWCSTASSTPRSGSAEFLLGQSRRLRGRVRPRRRGMCRRRRRRAAAWRTWGPPTTG